MAIYLTIAGIDYEVTDENAEEQEGRFIGAVSQMFDGSAISSIRARKRDWQFPLLPMDNTALGNLRASIALGVIVSCTATFLPGTVNCTVKVTRASYIHDADGFKRGVTVLLSEA